MPKSKIAVIGGAVMDMMFEVPKWPSAGEAIQGTLFKAPGGKGLNQAVGCARLGSDVSLISAIGEDRFGEELEGIIRDEYIRSSLLHVRRKDEIASDVTAVILTEGQHPGFIGCRQATNDLTPAFVEDKKTFIDEAGTLMITFDISIKAIQRAIHLAKSAQKVIIVNAAPPMKLPLSHLKGIDYLVFNNWEANEWLRLLHIISSDQHLSGEEIGKYFLLNAGVKTVIVTRGVGPSLVIRGEK